MDILLGKINNITKQYLTNFGRVGIGFYSLKISRSEPFSSFLNSLLITLRRKDQMPYYAWFSTAEPDARNLILWCNGYFRKDFSDITSIVFKMGKLHYVRELFLQEFILGDIASIDSINASLSNMVRNSYSQISGFHNRSFGTSMIYSANLPEERF